MNKIKFPFAMAGIIMVFGCSNPITTPSEEVHASITKLDKKVAVKPHRFGGWYCPDNLNGFPPVDLRNWHQVPVIEGRMPTKEETRTEKSLIYVDKSQYPSVKAFDIKLPQLASYFCEQSNRIETIIVIQAFTVENDTILGYRFLNGGNGSAHWNDVEFNFNPSADSSAKKFVTYDLEINALQDSIWQVITDKGYSELFERCFKENQYYQPNWRFNTNVNFFYKGNETQTSAYADLLYGSFYIQNNYEDYAEKILLLEDPKTKKTTLKIVCGPFNLDYEVQQDIVQKWALKVKSLVEGGC